MIEVICADLLECVDALPPFDVLITDPPYSSHVHDNATSAGTGGRGVRKRDLGFDAITRDLRGAIASLAARASRWSCIFSDFEGAHEWRAICERSEYIRTVPWIRWSQAQRSGDRPCTGAEAVLVFHGMRDSKPVRKHWNGPGSVTHLARHEEDGIAHSAHFERRCLRGKNKHPTEKPIDLMLDLVSWFSDPGELVLDPCAGSGSTALACRLLGRSCLALERDVTWANAAKMRADERYHLSDRDRVRALEWIESTTIEAARTPEPKAPDGSDVRTWERAQRRIADAERVRKAVA